MPPVPLKAGTLDPKSSTLLLNHCVLWLKGVFTHICDKYHYVIGSSYRFMMIAGKSTAMVMSRWSVNITTLFPGQA